MKIHTNKDNNISIDNNQELLQFNLPGVQEFLSNIPTCNPKKKLDDKLGPFTKFWYIIDWKLITLKVERMQHNVFQNHNNCRELQDSILNSPYSKLLAVKRVAFDNKGKKSAGLDKWKNLTHKEAIILAVGLKLDGKAKRIKRVWIPKPNTTEKRPLGIPVIRDRAKQALLKLALEPQWEAKFSPNVFGFRPGYGCIDAIWNIRNTLNNGPRYVYDADLEKCFDRISHNYLINKMGFSEKDIITKQIRSWLKAGILDTSNRILIKPTEGTAQGGVISPLLCNIALHGMHDAVTNYLKSHNIKTNLVQKTKLYTYADDLILLCISKRILFYCIAAIDEFLIPIGLNIKLKKTRKVHTLNKAITYALNLIEKIDEKGNYVFNPNEIYLPTVYGSKTPIPADNTFKFLGFKFICFPVGKHKWHKIAGGRAISRIVVYTLPTAESIKRHFRTIRMVMRKTSDSLILVKKLSPIIRGWLNYFSKSDLRTAKKVGLLRTRMNLMLLNWQKRVMQTRKRIPTNWKTINGDHWRFYAMQKDSKGKATKEIILPSHSDPKFSLIRYKPIKLGSSVFNGDLRYWSIRQKSVLGLTPRSTKVLARQLSTCPICNKDITINDDVKVIKSNDKSIKDKIKQLQVIHNLCTLKVLRKGIS